MPPGERTGPGGWPGGNPSLRAGAVALAIALAVAPLVPLDDRAARPRRSSPRLLSPLDVARAGRPDLLARIIRLAPATLALGLFAAARAIRQALTDESDDRAIVGGVFWVVWLAVAALAPAFWPSGRGPCGLFLLVPLNLLAAQAISDLAGRRVPVRTLTWIAPLTAVTVAWWVSANLREAVDDLAHGRADSATALGLHLALRPADRRRPDHPRARPLGPAPRRPPAAGPRRVPARGDGRHRRRGHPRGLVPPPGDRRPADAPDDDPEAEPGAAVHLVAVVGPEAFRAARDGPAPGGRLRFILRSALPDLPQRDLATTDELLALPDGQRLIILAGNEQRLLVRRAVAARPRSDPPRPHGRPRRLRHGEWLRSGKARPTRVLIIFGTQHIITDQWVRLGRRFAGEVAVSDPSCRDPHRVRFVRRSCFVRGTTQDSLRSGKARLVGASTFFGSLNTS